MVLIHCSIHIMTGYQYIWAKSSEHTLSLKHTMGNINPISMNCYAPVLPVDHFSYELNGQLDTFGTYRPIHTKITYVITMSNDIDFSVIITKWARTSPHKKCEFVSWCSCPLHVISPVIWPWHWPCWYTSPARDKQYAEYFMSKIIYTSSQTFCTIYILFSKYWR